MKTNAEVKVSYVDIMKRVYRKQQSSYGFWYDLCFHLNYVGLDLLGCHVETLIRCVIAI